ncbi:hypothetical protein CQW23_17163 [Capsicum baccatum]|uniref:Uncharacterized protein n=1 Tax=Capsicum baccatum TaxID=33114 RepID=A0A2G2WD34_CAPBA|nr:hypothetical protein CQW23_17163 [Capsicum baccatum]
MRVTATTLYGLSTAPELLQSTGGLADNRHFTSESSIIRSVKLVAESIARHIYSQEKKSISIFPDESSLAVNPSYIRSWLDLLSKTPRVSLFLSNNDPLIKALEKKLMDHIVEGKLRGRSKEVNKEKDVKRFIVELYWLTDLAFLKLMKQTKNEYGFGQKGVLEGYCLAEELQKILELTFIVV